MTIIVWVVVEILVEQLIGRELFGEIINDAWHQSTHILNWSLSNHILNISVALMNYILLIWLYASLRPRFGVGTKTALITSVFGLLLGLSMTINQINLGLYPIDIGLAEWAYELIEAPLAVIVGAFVYESSSEPMEAL